MYSCQSIVYTQIAKVCRVKMRIKLSMMLESNLHLLNKSVDIIQKTNQLRILSRNEVEVIWNIYFDIIVLVPFTMF